MLFYIKVFVNALVINMANEIYLLEGFNLNIFKNRLIKQKYMLNINQITQKTEFYDPIYCMLFKKSVFFFMEGTKL